MSIYEGLGVRTVVNGRGCATLAGGSLMDPQVVSAMAEAARAFVRIGDLQEAGGVRIAQLTGAQAGYVTSGAAAALTLGSAALLARLDPDRMDRLPETHDGPAEIVVLTGHRNPYDHLVRAAGARLVECASLDDIPAVIGPASAGAFFNGQAERLGPPFEAFVAAAHTHGLPVLVDASMSLPPRANLRRYTAAGADLVAFSGGKTIGGPQASGFLAGRADLILSVALQHQDMDVLAATWARRALLDSGVLARPPRHGIGRSMKTGKEEIVGLLTALQRYVDRDEAAERRGWEAVTRRLAAGLARIPGLTVEIEPTQADGRPVPMTAVRIDTRAYGRSAVELVRAFEARDPIILLDDHEAEAGLLRLDPENLDAAAADAVIGAFRLGGR